MVVRKSQRARDVMITPLVKTFISGIRSPPLWSDKQGICQSILQNCICAPQNMTESRALVLLGATVQLE